MFFVDIMGCFYITLLHYYTFHCVLNNFRSKYTIICRSLLSSSVYIIPICVWPCCFHGSCKIKGDYGNGSNAGLTVVHISHVFYTRAADEKNKSILGLFDVET